MSINCSTISRLLLFKIAFRCLCNKVWQAVHYVHGPRENFIVSGSLVVLRSVDSIRVCFILRSVVVTPCIYPLPTVWPTCCEGPLFPRAYPELYEPAPHGDTCYTW